MGTKSWFLGVSVSVLGIMMLSSLGAAAGQTYDKGELGKYERSGKHMNIVRTLPPKGTSTHSEHQHASKAGPAIDKGELGQYVRNGRYVTRVRKAKSHSGHQQHGQHAAEPKYRTVDHYKHTHKMPI